MKKKLTLFLLFSTTLFAKSFLLFFNANKELSSRELYNALSLKKPYFYEFYIDKPAIEIKDIELTLQALRDYYKLRGFYHAQLWYTKDKESITIHIKENNPVIVKSIAYISNLDFSKNNPLTEGDFFDADKFAQSKNDIKILYAQSAFCNASLDAKAWLDIEDNHAYIVYDITENEKCNFGNVDIKQSKSIDTKIVESIIHVKENTPFVLENIKKSYESLYRYEGVSKAIIDTSIDKNSNVDVVVSVIENEKPIRFITGLGISSDEGAMVLAGLKHRNFLSNLKTIGIETRLTNIRQTIKTNFDMPLLNKNSLGVELKHENEKFTTFKENRFLADVFFKHVATPHTLKQSIVFDKSKTYDSDDEDFFIKKSLFITSAKFEWNYDTRDKILSPTKGYFLNTQIMGSLKSNMSDATYYKLKTNGGYIASIDDYIIGLKATIGTLSINDGYIPASYRFFAGGMYSNRAYVYRKLSSTNSENEIGSESIVETTAEIRFPIYGDLRGVLFSDTTYLGNSGMPNYDNGYYSAGFGLRYNTPIGPIAIDMGFDIQNPTKQFAIHFRVGELF